MALPIILGRDKRHTDHDGVPHIPPHFDLDIRSLFVETVLDVSHSDVLTQSGRWDSGGDDA